MFRFSGKQVVRVVGAATLALVASIAPAQAATITFDFTGSGGIGTNPNSIPFTQSGVTVTATAWAYGSSFQTAALGQWSHGLGVCTSAELPSGCGSPNHEVDNAGTYDDYVLLRFSTPVDPLSLVIQTTSGDDVDVSYWTGNITLPADGLANDTYLDLTTLRGFGARIDNDGSGTIRTVPLTSGVVNGLLIGARYGQTDDAFKITSLTVDRTAVPEPASMVLLGTGLMGMVSRLKRRRA